MTKSANDNIMTRPHACRPKGRSRLSPLSITATSLKIDGETRDTDMNMNETVERRERNAASRLTDAMSQSCP